MVSVSLLYNKKIFPCVKKFSQKIFKKGIDNTRKRAILKVQKENNLQKMLASNINKGVSYYEG